MKRDIGDIIDRGSIAKLKNERIKESENIREYEAFEKEIESYTIAYPTFFVGMFFKMIYDINAMIWDLEADMRQGKLDGVLNEVGKRAIEIRKLNNLRVHVKNIINKLFGEGFTDVKQNNLSQM